MTKIKNVKDLIMLLLATKGVNGEENAPIIGRTRLMKMIFLFDKELKNAFRAGNIVDDTVLPKFEAYDYGPYSSDVYSALEWLVNMGFVEVSTDSSPESDGEAEEKELIHWFATKRKQADEEGDEIDEERFQGDKFLLTKLGCEFVSEMKSKWCLSNEQETLLSLFKMRCCQASLRALLGYVYNKYPETTTKSKIRDEILK